MMYHLHDDVLLSDRDFNRWSAIRTWCEPFQRGFLILAAGGCLGISAAKTENAADWLRVSPSGRSGTSIAGSMGRVAGVMGPPLSAPELGESDPEPCPSEEGTEPTKETKTIRAPSMTGTGTVSGSVV